MHSCRVIRSFWGFLDMATRVHLGSGCDCPFCAKSKRLVHIPRTLYGNENLNRISRSRDLDCSSQLPGVVSRSPGIRKTQHEFSREHGLTRINERKKNSSPVTCQFSGFLCILCGGRPGRVNGVPVAYKAKDRTSLPSYIIDLWGFNGGRCRIRTCDFHRVNTKNGRNLLKPNGTDGAL
jgi:hypothetical protein